MPIVRGQNLKIIVTATSPTQAVEAIKAMALPLSSIVDVPEAAGMNKLKEMAAAGYITGDKTSIHIVFDIREAALRWGQKKLESHMGELNKALRGLIIMRWRVYSLSVGYNVNIVVSSDEDERKVNIWQRVVALHKRWKMRRALAWVRKVDKKSPFSSTYEGASLTPLGGRLYIDSSTDVTFI